MKKSEQKRAQRAVDDAAEAAKKAKQALQQNKPEEAEEQQEQARKELQKAAEELEQERDRYQDQRQEELLFRMKEELQNLLDKQQPITQATLEAQKQASKDGVARAERRKLNQFGEQEQELAAKIDFMVKALAEEGNLVFQAVLKANGDDLREVARRLSGRSPDPSSYTTMLQQDVEHRSKDLLAALEREHQRRQEQQQPQQQQKPQNKFNPQQQRLVSMIADLQMLKQLEVDTRKATTDLGTLLALKGDEGPSEAESALVERLSHRHGEVTGLFQQIKAAMEQMLQEQEQDQQDDQGKGGGKDKGGRPGGGK
jgi:colicin import membrane protein